MLSRRSFIQFSLCLIPACTYAQEKKYSFGDLPVDDRPHGLISTDSDLKTTAMSMHGINSYIAKYESKEEIVQGRGYCSIIAFNRMHRTLGKSRSILLYLEVAPASDETKIGSQFFPYDQIDFLQTKLDEVLRIGRNMRDGNIYNKTTSLSPINNIVFEVYGIDYSELDNEAKSKANEKGVTLEPSINFRIINTERKVSMELFDLKEIHVLINSLKKAKEWLDSNSEISKKKDEFILPPPRTVNPIINSNPVVYITANGKKYHRYSCSSLKNSVISMNRQSAIIRGYGQCRLCRP
jgi:hypothetical protein